MSKYKKTHQIKLKLIDYILIIGIILAPMTGLRLWKIGPSEALVFLWCLVKLKNYKYINLKNYNVIFWIQFLFTIIFGTGYALIFYPIGTNPTGLFTYFYLAFISIGIYYGLKIYSLKMLEAIICRIALFGGLWYLFLFVYSKVVSKRFLGAPLWYGVQRFSGGGTNPHQIAVFLAAVIFISYYFFINCNKKRDKFLMLSNILITTFLGYETKSSTLVVAIGITMLILVITEIIYLNKYQKDRVLSSVFILLIIAIGISLFYTDIYQKLLDWIKSDPNGLGRFDIFSTISLPFSKSPLFGLGPGTHARGGIQELHNTYLEILAMGGSLGLLIFFRYSYKVFNILKHDYRLTFIILPLYIYGLAGFAMRRLVYWGILMIVVSLGEKVIDDKQKNS